MQGLRLFQQVLTVIFDLIAVPFFSDAIGANRGVHQFRHLFSHCRHAVSIHCLCQTVFRFIIPIRDRPRLTGDKHLAAGSAHIRPVVLLGIDDRFKSADLCHDANDRKGFPVDVDDGTDRALRGVQALDCGAVQNHCLGVIGIFLAQESPALLYFIACRIEIGSINAIHGATELGVLIIHIVAVGTCAVKRSRFHIFQAGDLIPHFRGNHLYPVRCRLIAEIIGTFPLIQLHINSVVAGTNQIVFDLLIGALNGRHNGNDRRNTDDNAQHSENGTHLMGQNAL